MSSFTTPLRTDFIDGVSWKIVVPFVYRIGSENSKEIITVPKGYITDFASIPKVFWSLIGHPAGPYGKAAVIHDFLYSCQTYTRLRSDKIFYEAMTVSKVKYWKRVIIYYVVRLSGRSAWKKGGKLDE